MAAMKREFEAQQKASEALQYKGFEIARCSGKWSVSNWPSLYSSKQKAFEAVDNCLSLRAMLAEAN